MARLPKLPRLPEVWHGLCYNRPAMTPSAPTHRSRAVTFTIVVVFTLVGSLFIHSRAYSSNDASRLATIESLVERGTWAIDASPFATVDRIKVGEHFYSDKPPILSLAGAGVYSILHNVFGLTLQPWGCTPERMPTWYAPCWKQTRPTGHTSSSRCCWWVCPRR